MILPIKMFTFIQQSLQTIDIAWNTNWREKLSSADQLIKVTCFVKRWLIFLILKAVNLNQVVQGGQVYVAFFLIKASLTKD
jgi:hypothetical protein